MPRNCTYVSSFRNALTDEYWTGNGWDMDKKNAYTIEPREVTSNEDREANKKSIQDYIIQNEELHKLYTEDNLAIDQLPGKCHQ